MNLPQFTAGLALNRSRQVYREFGAPTALDDAQLFVVESPVLPAGVCPPGFIGTPPNCYASSGPGGGNHCASACGTSCQGLSTLEYNFCYEQCYDACSQPGGGGECVAPPGSCDPKAYCQCVEQNRNLPPNSPMPACGLLYGPCLAGRTCCGGSCAETNSDSLNCGSCGHECSGGSACCSGGCCGGSAGGCSNEYGLGCGCCNLTNSEGGGTPTCVPVVKMDNGITTLQGRPFDSANCGTCGNVCGPGAGNVCCNSVCCSAGEGCCADSFGTAVCTPLNTNINCGTCGHECLHGQNCVDGQCVCPDEQSSLDTNRDCGTCGNVCRAGTTCCNGTCVNLNTNASNCGKCGNACPAGGACFNSCCVNNAPLLTSNNQVNTNYWLSTAGGCQNIQDLLVSLQVSPSANLASPNGFSLQLNALPLQPNSQNITWLQFAMAVSGSQVDANVEYWGNLTNQNTPNGCMAFSNQNLNVGCCSNGNCCNGWDSFWDPIFGGSCQTKIPFLSVPSNALPAGAWVAIFLSTNPSNGNVTAATFLYSDPSGATEFTVSIPGNLQVPIQSFQFVAVGQNGCANTQFSSGTGTITYAVGTGQQLCVDGGSPACPLAAAYAGETCETSNATYGPMSACCGNPMSQALFA